MGTALSDAVARAVPAALTAIIDQLQHLDIHVRRRESRTSAGHCFWGAICVQ
jgi:hypothetical protein